MIWVTTGIGVVLMMAAISAAIVAWIGTKIIGEDSSFTRLEIFAFVLLVQGIVLKIFAFVLLVQGIVLFGLSA